mmetsp:Transcript_30675/g.84297  ORF Transcript_30675/g.84297 Transcript_30675/m.84297 type:complete len:308 (+) Transcript_30675:527-1450(+)
MRGPAVLPEPYIHVPGADPGQSLLHVHNDVRDETDGVIRRVLRSDLDGPTAARLGQTMAKLGVNIDAELEPVTILLPCALQKVRHRPGEGVAIHGEHRQDGCDRKALHARDGIKLLYAFRQRPEVAAPVPQVADARPVGRPHLKVDLVADSDSHDAFRADVIDELPAGLPLLFVAVWPARHRHADQKLCAAGLRKAFQTLPSFVPVAMEKLRVSHPPWLEEAHREDFLVRVRPMCGDLIGTVLESGVVQRDAFPLWQHNLAKVEISLAIEDAIGRRRRWGKSGPVLAHGGVVWATVVVVLALVGALA